MPRPVKCRHIGFQPECTYFKPQGIPLRELEEVLLTLDEIEALRLADLKGLYQEQAAEQMNISRQTFGNIIHSAHRKIADALVNGKALRLQGGHICTAPRTFKCDTCRYEWQIAFGTDYPRECPQCRTEQID